MVREDPSSTSSERRAATVLVIDDNEANRELAKATLEDESYDVVLAASGADGLARFAEGPPDCVLLDIRMPGMDGFETCARLRELPQGLEVPVLFFTAARDVDTFDRAMIAGGDDFLTKPVRPTELVVRVQTALALRRAKTELREQYALVKRQRDALMRLQLQKERLTAFLVHDLKNPVNAMDLQAQVMMRDKAASTNVREAAGQIRSEAKRLTRMIVNLLDISKADEGELAPKIERIALPALVDEVFGELQTLAEDRKVSLRAELAAAEVAADPDLLRRVLTNLVENALRYAPSGTMVTVRSSAEPDTTELRVADEGRGIPAGLRDRIFDAFAQVEGSDGITSRTSRGLGLSFCRSAVEAHHGTIAVEDTPTGTTFCVRLPSAT